MPTLHGQYVRTHYPIVNNFRYLLINAVFPVNNCIHCSNAAYTHNFRTRKKHRAEMKPLYKEKWVIRVTLELSGMLSIKWKIKEFKIFKYISAK
jgi:hypothetical protein